MKIIKEHSAINLVIRNFGGSVEHYYHFLLGFLFPLALKYSNFRTLGETGPIYIRSCGPMDRILKEIDFPGVEIIDNQEHIQNSAKTTINGWNLKQETVFGMDFTNGDYPIEPILEAAAIIRSHLAAKFLEPSLDASYRLAPRKKRQILLINRSINAFYNSENAEIRTSGLQRRSIGNFSDIVSVLQAHDGHLNSVILENSTLAEQIYLFASSDIIVAQHGAALANIVWCKPNTRIIEIAPVGYRTTCFPPLSQRLRLDHRLVAQAGEHGNCDIDGLVSELIK